MDINENSYNAKISKFCLKYYDLFFAVFYILIITSLLYIAKSGIGVPDESFYFTIPHRILRGDSLIVDDWQVSQFSSFLQYLPLKIYCYVNGSLDGIILFFRYLYVIFQGITLLVLYPFFRKYRLKGAVALAVFGCYIPVMLETLNYYTLCLMPVSIVCTALIFSKKIKPPVLVILGFLFALGVLAEPLAAFAYFGYTLIVLIKKIAEKKHPNFIKSADYCVNTKYWVFFTAGIFAAAGIFLCYLFKNSDIKSTLSALPNLFNGVEYDFSASNGNIQTMKVVNRALELYGTLPAVGIALLTFISVVFYRFRDIIRPFVTAGVLAMLIFAYVHAIYIALNFNHTDYYLLFYGLPLYLCGPAFYVFTEKKDKKLFAFWCIGAVLSVLLDISSAVILGVFGAMASISSLIFAFTLADEQLNRIKKPIGNIKKTVKINTLLSFVCGLLCIVAILGNEVGFDIYRLNFNIIESAHSADYTHGVCDTKLTTGAYAGISTTKTVAEKYNAIHRDLDKIKDSTNGNVLIFDRFAYCYLYLDLPYATYSAWYIDWQENYRLLEYYEVLPEKIPDCIYLPKYDPYTYHFDTDIENKLEWLCSQFSLQVNEGEAGYILYNMD